MAPPLAFSLILSAGLCSSVLQRALACTRSPTPRRLAVIPTQPLRGNYARLRMVLTRAARGILGLRGLHVLRFHIHLVPFTIFVMVPHPRHPMR